MPVVREILRFAAVMPSARFQENVRPGNSFIGCTSAPTVGRACGTALLRAAVAGRSCGPELRAISEPPTCRDTAQKTRAPSARRRVTGRPAIGRTDASHGGSAAADVPNRAFRQLANALQYTSSPSTRRPWAT
jgi:hypothetical protein